MNITVDFVGLDNHPVFPSASFHEEQHADAKECIAETFIREKSILYLQRQCESLTAIN